MIRIALLLVVTGILMSPAYADEQDELRAPQVQADEIHRKLNAAGESTTPEDPARWVAAGERGYVNCLLTVLGEGPANNAIVTSGKRLPNLNDLATGNSSLLVWTRKLAFPYDRLSSQSVSEILIESFELRRNSKGRLKTILVKNDGAPLAVLFTAERNGAAIKLSVLRPQ